MVAQNNNSILVRIVSCLKTRRADRIAYLAASVVRDIVEGTEYIVLFDCTTAFIPECDTDNVQEVGENVFRRKVVPANRIIGWERFPLQVGAATS